MPSRALSAPSTSSTPVSQPGGPADQRERAPHAVEGDVDADPGHDRAGRAGSGGVTARQPDLERHQAGLDREPGQQQHLGGGADRAARDVGERGQHDGVRPGRQEQQPGQQRGPADLAERERDLGRGGPARLVALGAREQVEGERQRLPAEQRGERVLRGHDHRDRAERQRVARAQPPAGRLTLAGAPSWRTRPTPAPPRRSVSTRNIPDSRSAARRGRLLARHRVPEPAGHVELDRPARQRETAQHGQARRARRAEQVQRAAPQEPAA